MARRFALLFAAFVGTIPASAALVVLDFNNLQIGEEALNYYNGGFGSLGTGPGPSYGITFTPDFLTVAQGVFAPPFRAESLATASGTMNLPGGFSGPFSFYYTETSAGSAALYSGLNGTGTLLNTLFLPAESIFFPAGMVANQTFRSVVFSSPANTLVFDNVTFGALVVPEPTPAALVLVGIVVFWRLRKAPASS